MTSKVSFTRRALTCILTAAAIAASGCSTSSEAKSARYLDAGKKLLQKNDPTRAILQFRNAVAATPKNAEAFYQLSLAYLGVGDIRLGIGSLRKALELNPKHAAAQLRMAQLMTVASDLDYVKDARQRLENMLLDTPDDPDALHALAFAELKLGEPEDAMQHLGRAMELAPHDIMIPALMAQAKLQQGDIKGAEEILQKASANSPKSAEAALILGRFYSTQTRWAEAETEFHRALSLDPNSPSAFLGLAMLQIRTGRKQEAEQNFKRLSGLPNKNTKPVYAMFLFGEGRRDEAIREFERLAKQDPEDRLARVRLIAAYVAVKRTSEAESILDAALKKNPRDSDALLQRGEMLVDAAKLDRAEVDLSQVLGLQPDSAEVHYAIAKLRQARGESRIFRQEIAKALQLNPTLVAVRIEAAQDLLGSRDGKAALALLNEAPDAQKELVPVLVQRNWALWILGDMVEMRKGIDHGLSRARTTDLLLQDGLWDLRAGKFQAARAALEEALKIDPGDMRALSALNESYVAQKQSGVALQKVKEYAARQPNSAPVQEFLGVLLMASGDRRESRAAFERARTADPKFVQADLSLIQTDVLDGRFDDAKRRLDGVLAANPSNETARFWLSNVEITKGDRKAAFEHLRQVVNAEPNNAPALNNYAYLMSEFGNQPVEALKYAQKAKELVPGEPVYGDTLGWILYRKGLYSLAVPELERAVAHGANPVWKYHLAMAYAKSGDLDRGRATFERAFQASPNVPEAKMAQEIVHGAKR
jgi:tetratricopeptide (TPR) repeat protein